MNKLAIYHINNSEYCYSYDKKTGLCKIRVEKDDIDKIELFFYCKHKVWTGDSKFKKSKMVKTISDGIYDYFEGKIDIDANSICYYFKLFKKEDILFYGNYHFYDKKPNSTFYMFSFTSFNDADVFRTPEWAKDAIFYQIFPDRFNKSENYISGMEYAKWDKKPDYSSFHGGNIDGIVEKLDYLVDLGINAIYLNPINEAFAYHKYDTIDYYKIDNTFGNNKIFKKFVKTAHEKGIKVIMDLVLNHCSPDFFAFKDLKEKGEDSNYKDWFYVDSLPLKVEKNPNYKAFMYFKGMPKLNLDNPDTRKYFLEVAKFWINEADIDGYRLDVADEISGDFWKDFRKTCKDLKDDFLIIGEVWYDSRYWLKGDQFDTVMNYPFFLAVVPFIGKRSIKVTEFVKQLGYIDNLYKKQVKETLWNLIDSHDTKRFKFETKGCNQKLKLAVLLQFTLFGVPMIYYGDEVGMSGGRDPDNRKGMEWDEENQNLKVLDHYKKMTKLYKKFISLRRGETEIILADEETNALGFKRSYKKENVYIFVNNSPKRVEFKLPRENMYDVYNNVSLDEGFIEIKRNGFLILK